jgi:hypothetical protein
MKVTVEILRIGGGEQPKVLHSLTHEAHSLEAVAAAAQGVIDSGELPGQVDGYRLTTESGLEMYGWPDRGH